MKRITFFTIVSLFTLSIAAIENRDTIAFQFNDGLEGSYKKNILTGNLREGKSQYKSITIEDMLEDIESSNMPTAIPLDLTKKEFDKAFSLMALNDKNKISEQLAQLKIKELTDYWNSLNYLNSPELLKVVENSIFMQLQEILMTKPELTNTFIDQLPQQFYQNKKSEIINAINQKDQFGYTPLFRAAQKGNTNGIKELIKAGAKIKGYGSFVGNPLHAAAAFGHLAMMDILIEGGADLNKDAPIVIASMNGEPDAVIKLIEHGADVNQPLDEYYMAINVLSNFGSQNKDASEAVRKLIKAGADPNQRDKQKEVPLTLAAHKKKNVNVARVLIEEGADINATNAQGKTALDIAKEKGNTEMITLLEDAAKQKESSKN